MRRSAPAMILAAGLGSRLRPLTDELAKPLVWIGDRPALLHVADVLFAAGAPSVVANTHHRHADFEASELGPRVRLVREDRILGTAGGVRNAAPLLAPGTLTVWNGDVLAQVDLPALEAAHARSGALATLVVAPRERGEGTVGLGEEGAVVRLRGRTFGREVAGGDFLGVQRLGPALRERLPEEGCLVGDVYLPALERGERLGAFAHGGAWTDVGTLGAYVEANLAWLSGRGSTAYLHASATIGPRVSARRSVVLAGGSVEGEGALDEVIVWPGARALAPLSRAVVTPRGVVRVA